LLKITCTTTAKMFAAALLLAEPAVAATYTYDIDYAFPILRTGNGLGSASQNVAGKGSVKGTITLGDDFLTTQSLLSYDLTTTNTSGRSNVHASYHFSSADPNEQFGYIAPANVWDPTLDLTFSDPSYGTPCGPSAPIGQRGPYSIAGSLLTLEISRTFQPGDASFSMQGRELFGRTAYCAAVGYPLFELEHTAANNSFFAGGTLASVNPDPGTGPGPSVVPLPAGLPLLVAGFGVLGMMKRRSARTVIKGA